MPDEFFSGTDWQVSSGPYIERNVSDTYLWPVGANSGSGTKDALADGLHPVLAIGGRTAADGRPLNLTGVVVSYEPNDDIAVMNVANGMLVRQYVANILTYNGGVANTFETAPIPGQPVYVDDSDDLGEGVTLSMSPLNDAGVKNPLAGYLWWDQDEYKDIGKGGPNATDQFDTSLPDALTEQIYAIYLTNAVRDLA